MMDRGFPLVASLRRLERIAARVLLRLGPMARDQALRFLGGGLAGIAMEAVAAAQEVRWTVEALSGSAASVDTTLHVEQSGEPDLDVDARWSTRPFTTPIYWAVRVGRQSGGGAWELELVHHKIYLDDPTPDVEQFEITHGFNLALLNRTWVRSGWIFRFGAGAVVTHAQSRIRGLSSGREGDEINRYELAGPAFQAAVSRRFSFTRHFFGTLEGKVTWGYAKVSIAEGRASTGNFAFHGLFGLGAAFP
jgi:hypothetical protein